MDSCTKQGWRDDLDAKILMTRIQKQSAKHRHQRFREIPTRTYLCPTCKKYHMTSMSRD